MLLIRLTIIILGSLGFLGVGNISLLHWSGETSCPTIGIVPACYIILVGYGLILLSVFLKLKTSAIIFLIGWLPVIGLAFVGVIGDLTATVACPSSEIGIPKCYFSAGLSLIIGILYWQLYKMRLNKISR